jgi:hypothetical protein
MCKVVEPPKTKKGAKKMKKDSYDQAIEEIANEFQISRRVILKFNILVWSYKLGNYEGEAVLILQEKESGGLYEVNASHCSCFGLEGQFDLEPTSIEELDFRIRNNSDYGLEKDEFEHSFRNRLIAVLEELKKGGK